MKQVRTTLELTFRKPTFLRIERTYPSKNPALQTIRPAHYPVKQMITVLPAVSMQRCLPPELTKGSLFHMPQPQTGSRNWDKIFRILQAAISWRVSEFACATMRNRSMTGLGHAVLWWAIFATCIHASACHTVTLQQWLLESLENDQSNQLRTPYMQTAWPGDNG